MYWIIIVIVVVALMAGGGAIGKVRYKKGKGHRPNTGNGRANYGNQSSGGASSKELFDRQKKIWFANINKNAKVNANLSEKIDTFPFFNNFTETKQYLINKTSSMTKAKESAHDLDMLNNQFYDAFASADAMLLGNFNELGLGSSLQATAFASDVYTTFLQEVMPVTLHLLYAQGAQNFIDYCNGKIDKSTLISENSKLKSQYNSLLIQIVNEIVQQVYQTINQGYQSFDNQGWDQGWENEQDSSYYDQGGYDEEAEQASEVSIAYETLGVTETSTDAEVKAAYKKLAIKYHPDKNKTPEAAEMMTKVNAAYTLIKKIREM